MTSSTCRTWYPFALPPTRLKVDERQFRPAGMAQADQIVEAYVEGVPQRPLEQFSQPTHAMVP
jgi:hypothetical protein